MYFRQRHELSLEGALVALHAAIAQAKAIEVPQWVAIVDLGGNLLAFARMDGARVLAQFSAIQKAVTAVSIGSPTGEAPQEFGLKLALATGGRSVNLPGGLPIVIDGKVIGAIGVGSGTAQQDNAIAQAGVLALEEVIAKTRPQG